MKALEKDRRRRYETANALAADVMRYLTDEPVEACPPSARYRFSQVRPAQRGALTTAPFGREAWSRARRSAPGRRSEQPGPRCEPARSDRAYRPRPGRDRVPGRAALPRGHGHRRQPPPRAGSPPPRALPLGPVRDRRQHVTWLCKRERSTASSPTPRRASRQRSSRSAQVSGSAMPRTTSAPPRGVARLRLLVHRPPRVGTPSRHRRKAQRDRGIVPAGSPAGWLGRRALSPRRRPRAATARPHPSSRGLARRQSRRRQALRARARGPGPPLRRPVVRRCPKGRVAEPVQGPWRRGREPPPVRRSEVAVACSSPSGVNRITPSSTRTRPWRSALSRARRRSAGDWPLTSTASWMSKRSPRTDSASIAWDAVLAFPSIPPTVVPE